MFRRYISTPVFIGNVPHFSVFVMNDAGDLRPFTARDLEVIPDSLIANLDLIVEKPAPPSQDARTQGQTFGHSQCVPRGPFRTTAPCRHHPPRQRRVCSRSATARSSTPNGGGCLLCSSH